MNVGVLHCNMRSKRRSPAWEFSRPQLWRQPSPILPSSGLRVSSRPGSDWCRDRILQAERIGWGASRRWEMATCANFSLSGPRQSSDGLGARRRKPQTRCGACRRKSHRASSAWPWPTKPHGSSGLSCPNKRFTSQHEVSGCMKNAPYELHGQSQ